MSKDGPATQNLTERLKARSVAELRDVEERIRKDHKRLAVSLSQSSTDVLNTIKNAMDVPITEIERKLNRIKQILESEMDEIEERPLKGMRRTMILSAVIGGIVAMMPWAVMSYRGTQPTIFEERDRISAMNEIQIMTLDEEEVLILPRATTKIYTCRTHLGDRPCIRLEE